MRVRSGISRLVVTTWTDAVKSTSAVLQTRYMCGKLCTLRAWVLLIRVNFIVINPKQCWLRQAFVYSRFIASDRYLCGKFLLYSIVSPCTILYTIWFCVLSSFSTVCEEYSCRDGVNDTPKQNRNKDCMDWEDSEKQPHFQSKYRAETICVWEMCLCFYLYIE
jgi:hypothetical protein